MKTSNSTWFYDFTNISFEDTMKGEFAIFKGPWNWMWEQGLC